MNMTSLMRGVCMVGALLLLPGLAPAQRPDWAGQAGGGRHGRDDDRREEQRRYEDRRYEERRSDGRRHDDRRYDERRGDPRAGAPLPPPLPQGEARPGGYFGDDHRRAVHDYYQQQHRGGSCPPGLAKKNNGCMPPGQARKWNMGQPLPAGVSTYPLEQEILRRMGLPPAGHRYMRADSDILLLNNNNVVVDAIRNLGR